MFRRTKPFVFSLNQKSLSGNTSLPRNRRATENHNTLGKLLSLPVALHKLATAAAASSWSSRLAPAVDRKKTHAAPLSPKRERSRGEEQEGGALKQCQNHPTLIPREK